MKKSRKLIIVGSSGFAEIAREYFDADSNYEVVAFSVERNYLQFETLHDLPVVPFEDLEERFDPKDFDIFVAATYTELNRLRTRLSISAKKKGYRLASYVSSRAFVWKNVVLGEHCFIFEDNTLQPFVKIENNVIIWSGNHIGHHSTVCENCFISSHVVISGHCIIGKNSFIGVNATLGNNVSIGQDNWVGPGVTITRDTKMGELYKSYRCDPVKITTTRFFKIKD